MRNYVENQEIQFFDDAPRYAKEKAMIEEIIKKGYQKQPFLELSEKTPKLNK